MTYILSFIAYLITTSILGWLANRPKEKGISPTYINTNGMNLGEVHVFKPKPMSVMEWAAKTIETPPTPWLRDDVEHDGELMTGNQSRNRAIAWGVQCGKSEQQAEFLEKHLGKPFKQKV